MIFDLIYCLFWYEVHHNMEVPHTTLRKMLWEKVRGRGQATEDQVNQTEHYYFKLHWQAVSFWSLWRRLLNVQLLTYYFKAPKNIYKLCKNLSFIFHIVKSVKICTHETWMSDEINLQPSEQLLLSLPCFFEKLLVWKWLDFRCI